MIYLDNTLMKLQAVLGSAANTNQPVAHVWFYDVSSATKTGTEEYRGGMKRTAFNNTTDVDICDAPSQASMTRNVKSISILNRSLDTETVIVKTDDGTTEHELIRKQIATLETLHYEDRVGWYVTDA